MYHFIHFMQTIQKLSIGGILLCEDDIRIITYDHCVGVIRVAPTYVNDSHRGNGWFRLGQSTPKRIGDVESNRWAAHLPGRTSSLALQAEAKGEMSQESNDHVLLYYTVLIPPNPYQWKILWKIISIYRCYRWWSEASWAPHSLSLVVYDGQRCYAQQYPSTSRREWRSHGTDPAATTTTTTTRTRTRIIIVGDCLHHSGPDRDFAMKLEREGLTGPWFKHLRHIPQLASSHAVVIGFPWIFSVLSPVTVFASEIRRPPPRRRCHGPAELLLRTTGEEQLQFIS